MKPRNLIEIKAKMLCEGVNLTPEIEELFSKQNPSGIKRGGLSSGGKMKLAGRIQVNAPFYRSIKVDLKLVPDISCPNGFIVDYYGEPLCTGEILEAPNWYKEKIEGFSITQIITAHGRQLAGAIYENCSLFGIGEECKFCVINHSLNNRSPFLVLKKADLFIKALSKIRLIDYDGLSLNGGMTLNSGRGMEIIEPVVKEIHKVYPTLNIAIEITPPKDLTWINRLKEAGVSSLMMNLECWDDEIRKEIIPGKNKLCSKEMYMKAFEQAVDVFGNGKVSSCFVIGTERPESIKEGIRVITDLGVVPSPLAGRYFEDIPDYPFIPRVSFYELIDVMVYTNKLMYEKGLISTDTSGCVACGMCDLIRDRELF